MRIVVGGSLMGIVIVMAGTASAKPGAIVIPPAEVDVGAGVPLGDHAIVGTSTEIRAGVHLASLYWKPTRLDFGIGYAGSFRDLAPAASPREMSTTETPTLSLNGFYVTAAYAIENHPHWRTWLGARAEMLAGRADREKLTTTGFALRLATELYAASARGGGNHNAAGFFAGSFAIGVYVETMRRSLPVELGPVGVAAGLTVRVPFIAAVAD